MKINRLENKLGYGIVTRHTDYLSSKGYTILCINLSLIEDIHFNYKTLILDKSIDKFVECEGTTTKIIENIHKNGGKVALNLYFYEENKERFSTIRNLIEKQNNIFSMKEDDIIFFKSNTDVTFY